MERTRLLDMVLLVSGVLTLTAMLFAIVIFSLLGILLWFWTFNRASYTHHGHESDDRTGHHHHRRNTQGSGSTVSDPSRMSLREWEQWEVEVAVREEGGAQQQQQQRDFRISEMGYRDLRGDDEDDLAYRYRRRSSPFQGRRGTVMGVLGRGGVGERCDRQHRRRASEVVAGEMQPLSPEKHAGAGANRERRRRSSMLLTERACISDP